ncbi:hypothetical protein [Paenibacillus elgii]|uniref:Uncharacterized protein n=1 Tax=Paenibacillus elgii TaxID=189691 RepID=A0A161UR83_9BACL|nr:hypothetical protein [Paenibacillus elgii]KZE80151.1 hypothetical protein AV654_14280 [Paenibacillus elgii]NEN83451.1 hypothetical protein [Paenibacillus elgii]PUA38494.1 hypothetical protein C8Z91_14800 [Paenibacillus elgii]
MNEFIKIKGLEGDLKISHKKRDFGLTVSTKELVFQKPHANYHIKLEDIISILPYEPPYGARPITFQKSGASGSETVSMQSGMPHYRLYVKEATVHNRSGIFRLDGVQFVLPILRDLLLAISQYGGLKSFT